MGTMGSCGWSPATAAGGGSSNGDEDALDTRIGSSSPVRAWKTSMSVGHGARGDGWTRGSRGGAGRIVGFSAFGQVAALGIEPPARSGSGHEVGSKEGGGGWMDLDQGRMRLVIGSLVIPRGKRRGDKVEVFAAAGRK